MRIFWISLTILIIFIILGLYISHSLQVSTLKMIKIIEVMEKKVKQNDWKGMNDYFIVLQKKWKKMDRPWKMFIEHEEMDKIQLRMVELKEYILYQDEILTKANLSALKYLLRHIYTKNRLELGNIF